MSLNELIIEVFKKIDEQLLKLQSTRSFKIIIIITIVITSFGWVFAYGYLLNKSTIELTKMKPASMFFMEIIILMLVWDLLKIRN